MSDVTKFKLLVKNLPENFCEERLINFLKIYGIEDIYKIHKKSKNNDNMVIIKAKTIPILLERLPGSILSIKYYLNNQIDIFRLK